MKFSSQNAYRVTGAVRAVKPQALRRWRPRNPDSHRYNLRYYQNFQVLYGGSRTHIYNGECLCIHACTNIHPLHIQAIRHTVIAFSSGLNFLTWKSFLSRCLYFSAMCIAKCFADAGYQCGIFVAILNIQH